LPGTGEECAELLSESGTGQEEELSRDRARGTRGFVASAFHRPWLWALALVAVTLVAYLPAMRGQFLWDDDAWTSDISGLLWNFSGLLSMWSKPTALQQYYPLAGTSFWLDYQLWGFRALPCHVENVLLHAFAALLFWRLLRRLEVPGAGLAGAIFALHPLMVESAGWITERKNVLSLVFYLGALLAYGRFTGFWREEGDNGTASVPAGSRGHPRASYAVAFLLFLAALLAKATAFSLPAVILLLCWWKRGRIRWRSDVLPAAPFFALTLGLGLVTAWLEKNHVGAKGPDWALSFPERCLIAGRAPWFYCGKLIWPANLCFVYPRWHLDAASLGQWIYPVAAIGALLILWFARARIGRGPATAAFFFVGTLFPVLGFMNAYFMRYSFVCDHWVYLSSLGLIALAAALVARVFERLRASAVLPGFAVMALSVLAVLTWRQGRMYTDSETLWRTTLSRNPDAFMAHNNLGLSLYRRGQWDEAIVHFRRAVQIRPGHAEPQNNLGEALLQKGNVDEAIAHFRKAATLQPDGITALNNLGVALRRKGCADEAAACFQKVLLKDPKNVMAHTELGRALLQKGLVDEAIAHFRQAVRIDPTLAAVHVNLARVYLQQGKAREATAHFEAALEAQPAPADLYNDLAWVLATCPEPSIRNGTRAVELAKQAEQLSGGTSPSILATLAAAYAEAGRFPEAVDTARRALELATAQTNAAQRSAFQARLGLYQSGLPFRDPALMRAAP
jgi:tetratricopeptide (TPR) repeat protein